MESFLLKQCSDCNELHNLLSSIDKKIGLLTRAKYFNKVYLTDKQVDHRALKDLIYYRRMVTQLSFDPLSYYPDYKLTDIISKVKTLL